MLLIQKKTHKKKTHYSNDLLETADLYQFVFNCVSVVAREKIALSLVITGLKQIMNISDYFLWN